jgi:transposase
MAYSKQSIGIDISKDSFTACVCKREISGSFVFSKVASFSNEKSGFNQFLRWVNSEIEKSTELVFLMEATGVYYESLAHHLFKLKKTVHVALPNTTKHYFSSLNVKTKTDAIDARWLSQFGAERNHKAWIPPSPIIIELRNLTRYHVQLQEQRTALGNIKHSKDCSHEVQKFILQSNKQLIVQIDKQIAKCKEEIERLIYSDEYLSQKVRKLLTIKGVGLMTIATILAETMCFERFQNIKQLTSFAGYDVVQRESGTSVKGQTRISKKGNRYIRNALYFPAMVSCRYNPQMKEAYIRINMKKSSKMIGQVAIQRKLLALIFTLWKNDTTFDPEYKKVVPVRTETTQDSLTCKLL